jgi:hypothetical protein
MFIFDSKYSTMKKIIFLFAAIAALTSCTITKRHYAPGYHVEWKSLRSKEVVPQPIEESIASRKDVIKTETTIVDQNFAQPNLTTVQNAERMGVEENEVSMESVVPENSVSAEMQLVQVDQVFQSNEQGSSPEAPIEEAPIAAPPTGNINTMALVGFCLSVGSALLLITCIPGLICSIIGLKQIKAGNGEGKGFAIAGIVIGALYTLLILFYVAYLAVIIAYGGF